MSPTTPIHTAFSRTVGGRRFFAFWAAALAAIAALLVTVAILQYRWTGQASDAEKMRIGAELESMMTRWHSDLYGELTAICIAMQVGPDSGARDTWHDYLERYVEWNYALPHETSPNIYRNPDLIGDIYIWETGGLSEPRLFLLNINSKKIESSLVPANLSPLLARLHANSSNISMALRAWLPTEYHEALGSGSPLRPDPVHLGSNSMAGWQFDPSMPAIVHPIVHRNSNMSPNRDSPVDWIVITLDMDVLQQAIFPKLAERCFGNLDGSDYRVRVIETGTFPRTLFSSEAGFGGQAGDIVDSSMDIFGSHPSDEDQTLRGSSLVGSEWRTFATPEWFPVIQSGSTPSVWVLEVQHRAGPLQDVITHVRQKNLAVSAFVLLLLAVNIGVMTIAGFGAHRFAKLQMDFVASVSHELRTPLTAIFSAGENLKDGVVREKAGLQQYGQLIMSQARQLMNNVDRVLLFASIGSGKDRYSMRPVEVTKILESVCHDMSALLAEGECHVELQVEPAVSSVLADPMALSSCLENLITNAIKYGGSDRRVRLSAAREWTELRGYEVAISVRDGGMGIRSSELGRIFDPFYRSPEAVNRQIHGTGLGLFLAKHFAEAMHGRLSVVTEVGVGSVFTVRLPVPRTDVNGFPTGDRENKGDGNE